MELGLELAWVFRVDSRNIVSNVVLLTDELNLIIYLMELFAVVGGIANNLSTFLNTDAQSRRVNVLGVIHCNKRFTNAE